MRSLREDFGDPAGELRAALAHCALCDRSGFGRITAAGKDVLDLLHRLSTADVKGLGEAKGRPAVLTTPKGRIVDRIFVHHLGAAGVLLVTGQGAGPRVRAHIDRFTFAEDTGLRDDTDSSCQLCLVGPRAREVAAAAGAPLPAAAYASATWQREDGLVHVLGHDGLSKEGLSFVADQSCASGLRNHLAAAVERAGGRRAGTLADESWRVLRGLPMSGRELTEEHNPLEAGLREAVSFTKGCYVGQEVIARLNTYDKVSRVLAGLVLPAGAEAPEPGALVLAGDQEIGAVTSGIVPPGRKAPVALAYLRRDKTTDGGTLRIGPPPGVEAVVSALPFGETP